MKKKFLLGLAAMLLSWTVWAAVEGSTTLQSSFVVEGVENGEEIKYNGDDTAPSITVKYADVEGELDEQFYQVTYYQQKGEELEEVKTVRNVGTYTLKVEGIKAPYIYDPGLEITFTVTPKELTAVKVVGRLTKEYGDSYEGFELAGIVELTGIVGTENAVGSSDEENKDEFENALGCLKLSRAFNAPETVGEVSVVFLEGKTGEELDGTSNYVFKGLKQSVDVDITKKVLSLDMLSVGTIEDGKITREYDGETTDPATIEGNISVENKITEETETVAVTFVEKAEEVIKNVGKYTLVATIDEQNTNNYTFGNKEGEDVDEIEIPYEITRKEITITAPENKSLLSKVYGADDPDLTKLYIIEGLIEEEGEPELYMVRSAGETVGTYYVNPAVGTTQADIIWKGSKGGYEEPEDLPNYWINYDRSTKDFTINKKEVTYYFTSVGKVYDAETVTNEELKEGVNYEIVLVDRFVGEDDFTVAPKPVFAKVTTGEGEDATETDPTVKNVGEYTLVADEEEADYNNTNYTIRFVADPTLTDAEDSEAEAVAEETEEAEDEQVTVKPNVYEITKATVTLEPKPQTVDFEDIDLATGTVSEEIQNEWRNGSGNTNIGMPTAIQIDRKKDADAIRSMITFTIAPAGADEDYDYVITAQVVEPEEGGWTTDAQKAVWQNYHIMPGTTTLTVNTVTDPLVLDGSIEDESLLETLQTNSGAKYEKVYIQNIKNFINANIEVGENDVIEAEKWYSLVLPFNIEVRELSEKFGYAIVNIPNTANSDKNKVLFKLCMQEIPANTPILFKVYKEMNWNEIGEKNIFFENKKIVAPTFEYSVDNGNKDEAGNEFRPVYVRDVLTDAEDWFVLPYDGVFYNPVASGVGEFTIYPLNGYVHFNPNADLSEARIYVEEADGSTTAISTVTGKVADNNAEGWYTVGGVKLEGEPTQKGIYINNGKKVVIK